MRAPTLKQMAYLDSLAFELGYRTGKAFARDVLPDRWDKESVSRCIDAALHKIARTSSVQRQRNRAKAALAQR